MPRKRRTSGTAGWMSVILLLGRPRFAWELRLNQLPLSPCSMMSFLGCLKGLLLLFYILLGPRTCWFASEAPPVGVSVSRDEVSQMLRAWVVASCLSMITLKLIPCSPCPEHLEILRLKHACGDITARHHSRNSNVVGKRSSATG